MSNTASARSCESGPLLPFRTALLALLAGLCLAAAPAAAGGDRTAYVQRNLVSDGSIPAEHTDPNLISPWGIALTSTGMVWIAGNGTSASTVYDGQGNSLHGSRLAVDIPGGSPTGMVANDGPDFAIPNRHGRASPSTFIFVTEAGVISGWSVQADPARAKVVVDRSQGGAVYKGVAIAANGTDRFLYATDFHGGKVDVFDSQFQPVRLPAGAFEDDYLPPGFAPFGIQNIQGSLYVTFARQDRNRQDSVSGPGQGFVDVFDADGRLIRRLVSRGPLNAPWGMALAPADFGQFSNHLLVANFGDGRINAYSLSTGEFKGQIQNADRQPISIRGLWGICFGNGVKNQPTNVLFFTAGPRDENQGLYGRIEQGGELLAANARVKVLPVLPPQAKEQPLRRAETRKTTLQKVEADEGGDSEEPAGDEEGTDLDTEDQGQEDETASQDTYDAFYIHAPTPFQ